MRWYPKAGESGASVVAGQASTLRSAEAHEMGCGWEEVPEAGWSGRRVASCVAEPCHACDVSESIAATLLAPHAGSSAGAGGGGIGGGAGGG